MSAPFPMPSTVVDAVEALRQAQDDPDDTDGLELDCQVALADALYQWLHDELGVTWYPTITPTIRQAIRHRSAS